MTRLLSLHGDLSCPEPHVSAHALPGLPSRRLKAGSGVQVTPILAGGGRDSWWVGGTLWQRKGFAHRGTELWCGLSEETEALTKKHLSQQVCGCPLT